MEVFRKDKPTNKVRVLFIVACITFPIINWLIFYIFANFQSFGMAFTNRHGELSLDNFARFVGEFSDPDSTLPIAFKNTFITFGIILVSFPFKVLVSYFIYKKIPGYKFYKIVFFVPMVLFSLALDLVVARLLSVDGFIAQAVQEWLHLDATPELLGDSRYANIVIWLHMIWMGFPGDLIIWGGTFARIPEEVLESAKVDGVNWWQEFTKIIVPLVWPTVTLQMVLMLCGIFSASGAVFTLTRGEYGTMTLSNWIFMQTLYISNNYSNSNAFNYVSAVGLILSTVAIIISLTVRRFADKHFSEVEY